MLSTGQQLTSLGEVQGKHRTLPERQTNGAGWLKHEPALICRFVIFVRLRVCYSEPFILQAVTCPRCRNGLPWFAVSLPKLSPVVQMQNTVADYFTSKQALTFSFAELRWCGYPNFWTSVWFRDLRSGVNSKGHPKQNLKFLFYFNVFWWNICR